MTVNKDTLDKESREAIIREFQLHEKDTGSADVQIAILTEQIVELIAHIKRHPHDKHAKVVLLQLVHSRRKLLSYLQGVNPRRAEIVIDKLGI